MFTLKAIRCIGFVGREVAGGNDVFVCLKETHPALEGLAVGEEPVVIQDASYRGGGNIEALKVDCVGDTLITPCRILLCNT